MFPLPQIKRGKAEIRLNEDERLLSEWHRALVSDVDAGGEFFLRVDWR